MKMSALDWVGLVLVIVGALNWGLVGAFDYNLVDGIFGVASGASRVIYILVGLGGLWTIYSASKMGK